MTGFTGSEVVTLELVEHFSHLGWSVTLQTGAVGAPMQEHLLKIPRLTLAPLGELDSAIDAFDLVWCHHQIIPIDAMKRGREGKWNTPTIFHHMSPFVDLESPIFPRVELALASKILYNSPETQESIRERFFQARIADDHVFGNPAPDKFRGPNFKGSPTSTLKRLLLVSNHVPAEVRDAMEFLKEKGVAIRHIGQRGQKYQLVQPLDISGSDAVLTIGKSAQYAIVGGVPVYCYDHFGGPGYLSTDTFDLAAHNNFSGRGFQRKSAQGIADDLLSGFKSATEFADSLSGSPTVERYSLSHQVDLILGNLRLPAAKSGQIAATMDWEAAMATRRMLDGLWSADWAVRRSTSWKLTAPLRKVQGIWRDTRPRGV